RPLARAAAPAAPAHHGPPLLLVDMRAPGLVIRPLVEMTGVAWFNEVFFDGVVVPHAHVVGAVGEGWSVAMTTLAHERTVASPPLRLAAEAREVVAGAAAAGAPPRRRRPPPSRPGPR